MFFGAIGYADDIALLAPSLSALKQMLKICDEFAAEYSVTFNIEKYQLIHYTRYLEIHSIKHNGIFIKCHDYANHLGHVIEKELHLRVTKKFISTFHGINAIFSRACVNVRYRLFKTYFMDLYGCNFWNLAESDVLSFFTLWRKCIRKLLYLSPMTHSRFLPLLCDDIPVELQLFRRFNKFLWNVFF